MGFCQGIQFDFIEGVKSIHADVNVIKLIIFGNNVFQPLIKIGGHNLVVYYNSFMIRGYLLTYLFMIFIVPTKNI